MWDVLVDVDQIIGHTVLWGIVGPLGLNCERFVEIFRSIGHQLDLIYGLSLVNLVKIS